MSHTTVATVLAVIDFNFNERSLRGIEQNPIPNRAEQPWPGRKSVKQFLENGLRLAVVVDGKLHTYQHFSINI